MLFLALGCPTVRDLVGRVPLIPLFLAGNSTPTIPHKFSKHKGSVFPFGCADSTTPDGRRGSNVYEVKTWLWNFGRGKPSLGASGWSECGRDFNEEENSERGPSQTFCGDP